ncbi:MAG: DUF177 domain-containing protein [Clostridia bacterium]
MIIDFSNAIEGEFYTIDETIVLDNALIGTRTGHFLTSATINGWYTLMEGSLAINADLRVKAEFECDRCLAPTVVDLKIPISETFFKDKLDDETLTYEEERIDLQPIIDERIVLAIPSRVLCKKSCKGLCQICGHNLNEGDCNCNIISQKEDDNSPFSVLKNMNIKSGGATNGSTKM